MIAQALGRGILLITAFAPGITGCGSPAARFDTAAAEVGAQRVDASLPVFRRGEPVDGEDLHIYLDGDGTPVAGSGRIALDPTSRDRVILGLLGADPNPAVLIGRPCYHGAKQGCDPSLWTVDRYSDAVIERLAAAVDELIAAYPKSRITLIGYSGGGTLALLIAPRVRRIDAVVTIAANLDTAAWTRHHGYGPLSGSRNPATEPPLDPRIRQFHFFGGSDTNAPIALARATLDRQPAITVEVIDGYTHGCCWPEIWASRLEEITRRLDTGDAEI